MFLPRRIRLMLYHRSIFSLFCVAVLSNHPNSMFPVHSDRGATQNSERRRQHPPVAIAIRESRFPAESESPDCLAAADVSRRTSSQRSSPAVSFIPPLGMAQPACRATEPTLVKTTIDAESFYEQPETRRNDQTLKRPNLTEKLREQLPLLSRVRTFQKCCRRTTAGLPCGCWNP